MAKGPKLQLRISSEKGLLALPLASRPFSYAGSGGGGAEKGFDTI